MSLQVILVIYFRRVLEELRGLRLLEVSRSLTVDFIFYLFTLFYFYFYFIFLFLEQLGLGFISHAVTSVTS